jgi:hypothetical protein
LILSGLLAADTATNNKTTAAAIRTCAVALTGILKYFFIISANLVII